MPYLTPTEIETIAAKLAKVAREELDDTLPEWGAFSEPSKVHYRDVVRDVARAGAGPDVKLEMLAKKLVDEHVEARAKEEKKPVSKKEPDLPGVDNLTALGHQAKQDPPPDDDLTTVEHHALPRPVIGDPLLGASAFRPPVPTAPLKPEPVKVIEPAPPPQPGKPGKP